MADYLLVYDGGRMPETPAEQAQVMQAWGAWFEKLGSALKDGGNPFSPQAKTIEPSGAVSDGGVSEHLSGYSIITAGSLDEAVNMSKGCPVLQGGATVHVFETFDVMASMGAHQH